MAIITKPSTITKGEVASIELNKSELASVASVAADEYYSDSSNWSKVILNYKSEEINQFHVVTFDATQSSPSSSFLASERAWDVFQILSIDIIDFDNGFFRIDASELVASEFEIDMGAIAPATGIPFQLFDNFQSYNPLTDPTFLERSVDGFGTPTSRALHNVSLGSVVNGEANYDITFNLSNITSNTGYGIYIGIIGSSDSPSVVSLADVSSNYESYAVSAIVNAGTSMGVVVPFQGGYSSPIVPAGATKSIRFKQTGTTLEYYVNGSLVYTQSVDISKNVPYLYPYVLGNWTVAVDSVTIVDTNNYVQWVNPFPDAYVIEADGGLTNGPARGSSHYLNTYDPTNTFNGDFELIFNVGSLFDHDTAFGVVAVSDNGSFCGALSNGGTGTVFLNNTAVGSFGSSLVNKEFKLTRIGTTYSYYADGVLIYSGEGIGLALGEVKPVATLNSPSYGSGGILNSATYTLI